MTDPDEPTFIYELRDPISGRPKYIGMSVCANWNCDPNYALRERLRAHVWGAQYAPPDKKEWLLGLRLMGHWPIIRLLETHPYKNARAAERRWIEYLRDRGESIFNRYPFPPRPPRPRCPTCNRVMPKSEEPAGVS